MGRAMGVEVGRNERGWEASVCEVELTGEGRRVFGVEKLVSVPPFCAYDGGMGGRWGGMLMGE